MSEDFTRAHPQLASIARQCMALPVSCWREVASASIAEQPDVIILVTKKERSQSQIQQQKNTMDASAFLSKYSVVEQSCLSMASTRADRN